MSTNEPSCVHFLKLFFVSLLVLAMAACGEEPAQVEPPAATAAAAPELPSAKAPTDAPAVETVETKKKKTPTKAAKKRRRFRKQKKAVDESQIDPLLLETYKALVAFDKAVSLDPPDVPYVDFTDQLRCFTSSQKRASKSISDLCKKIKAEYKSSQGDERKNEKAWSRYESGFSHYHYRIDFDWGTRMGVLRKDKNGCWNSDVGAWTAARKQADCSHTWKLRTYAYQKSKKGNAYSANQTPDKPNLMHQIAKGKVTTPDRFVCHVLDVESSGKGDKLSAEITCKKTEELRTRIDIRGDRTDINRGDYVSVPWASARQSGLLLRKNKSRDIWRISAQAADVKIDQARGCPSADDLAPHFCRFAGNKSEPVRTFSACKTAGDHVKVAGLLKTWDRARKLSNKASLMIDATGYVLESGQGGAFVQLMRARYQIEANQTANAKASLTAAMQTGADKKILAEVARIASKTELSDIAMSAYKAGCAQGDKRACAKLPPEPVEEAATE